MAIDSTRGLPSFGEMYEAYKQRGNLGNVINAGVQGYKEAKAAKSQQALEAAQAAKNQAEAAYNLAHARLAQQNSGVIRLDQITDPKEKADLAQYATPNADGILIVPLGTYNAVTHKAQNQESIDLKHQLQQQQEEHETAQIENARKLSDISAQKEALQKQLAPKTQAINAAHDLAASAGTVEPPTLINRGISAVKEMFGGQPTVSVEAERQGEAARQALQGAITPANQGPQAGEPLPTGGPVSSNPVDQATGINPTDPETLRLQGVLKSLNLPVTDANLAHAKAKGL